MDASLKELAKLEQLAASNAGASSSKGKSVSINDSLEALLYTLREAKERIQAGNASPDTLNDINTKVESTRKDIDERQKEVYNSLARYGKTLDKKFTSPLPSYTPLFSSPEATDALNKTIALHFLRTGQSNVAETFIEEAGVDISLATRRNFTELHRIVTALRRQDIAPALEWTERNRDFLRERSSALEFLLHRSLFMRILLSSHPPNGSAAIAYGKAKFPPFYDDYGAEINRLITCVIYFRLQESPYADLASPSLHFELEPMFAKEFCACLGMSRQVPLRVVGDIGGGGALARIEKGRKIMRERKSEWSQTDELPIEIPLSAENRYHSIFACPVSKEQATEQNPPMMMTCGHVVTKDSLTKLCKSGGRFKCPYCPTESVLNQALRVHF
ncbi:hypothetical protein QCA50_003187 [Cerrena zonata]|uniref:GID complex catalytic subunit 2 n=1 Tax=Cerrena zonata TaxID=2478898 RepID=A0AAW0GTG1_9APHY